MSNAFRQSNRSRRSSSRHAPLYPVPSRAHSVRPSYRNHPQPDLIPLSPRVPNRVPSPIRRLPLSRPMPLWLRWLIGLQRGSFVFLFLLAIATLVVYSGTVYTQHLWSKEYNKLKTLQRSEREMLAADATMKNYLAKQAERPGSGLTTQTPSSTIFLQAAPKRRGQAMQNSVSTPTPQPDKPLGY